MDLIEFYNQQLSLIGAFLILLAYMGQQFKWKFLSSKDIFYNVINIFGASILCLVALKPFVAGFAILEFIWALVSVISLIRIIKK